MSSQIKRSNVIHLLRGTSMEQACLSYLLSLPPSEDVLSEIYEAERASGGALRTRLVGMLGYAVAAGWTKNQSKFIESVDWLSGRPLVHRGMLSDVVVDDLARFGVFLGCVRSGLSSKRGWMLDVMFECRRASRDCGWVFDACVMVLDGLDGETIGDVWSDPSLSDIRLILADRGVMTDKYVEQDRVLFERLPARQFDDLLRGAVADHVAIVVGGSVRVGDVEAIGFGDSSRSNTRTRRVAVLNQLLKERFGSPSEVYRLVAGALSGLEDELPALTGSISHAQYCFDVSRLVVRRSLEGTLLAAMRDVQQWGPEVQKVIGDLIREWDTPPKG